MTTLSLILISILGILCSALCTCLAVLLEMKIENCKEKENKNEHTCQRKV